MKTLSLLTMCGVVLVCGVAAGSDAILKQPFDLGTERSAEVQYFVMTSKSTNYALDGTRLGTDTMRLRLKCVPAKVSGQEVDQYTCAEFTIEFGDAPEVSLPALGNWTYDFAPSDTGIDDKGQVFGIDHSKFENLTDANGKPVAPDKPYVIYNAFIDFHAFCNVFARPVAGGKGIQDLERIGDRIVHATAFSEGPVHLGRHVTKGSTFTNGEITLELRGLSVVDGHACAMVAYDSGDSSFQMRIQPMPSMETRVVGASHYQGDLYVDLGTRWVRKATMYEMVVAEVTLPVPPNKVNGVTEREILIRNVSAEEFGAR